MRTAEKATLNKPLHNMYDARYIELIQALVKDLGHEIRKDFTILDFGCGEGDLVHQWRKAGLEAFGADIKLDKKREFLRLIDNDGTYRIPFDDNTFDFVFSNQVLEHVRNLEPVLAEIYRVLKPRGVSLHIFPPKLTPVEAHVCVPLGGKFQGYFGCGSGLDLGLETLSREV
jgi:ubiquinone/menaquinone biosynthesis C-methylase UbiE